MTRLEKALAQLTKSMGRRPFVVVYDSCHPENDRPNLSVVWGNGYTNALGLLTWGMDRALHPVPTPADKEPDA